MEKRVNMKAVLSCILTFVLIGSSCFVAAQSAEYPMGLNSVEILYVGGAGPGNYSSIQDAVNHASDGDTVFVYDDSAPYYENIIINVSIHLIGENRNTTSIEGGNHAITIVVDGVSVSGFRISNVGDFWNCCGFYVISQGNNISNNNIINNLRMNGIFLDGASFNTISGNLIENNRYHGIRVDYASHNLILNNVLVNNRGYGIYLYEAQDTMVVGNTIQQSFFDGLMLSGTCINNTIYHNNFIDNPGNAYDTTGNLWDNGSSGNYWSDYSGSDSDGDGIGDIPYLIPGNVSQDRFPLMEPYERTPVNVTISISGVIGLTIAVKNQGAEDLLSVDWESHLTGGFVLRPSKRDFHGTILYLGPGEELVIQKISPLLGFGFVETSVTVGKTTESMKKLFLFFMIIIPPL